MRRLRIAAFAGMASLTGGPLAAQTVDAPASPEASPRYTFNRVDDGYLRLDNSSGQVTLCSQRNVGWACQAVPEDRAALDSEIARLQAEVDRLTTEIAALRAPAEPPRPPGDLTPRKDDGKTLTLKLPSDEDIKWAREAIEKVWRQFVDMVAEFQKGGGRKG
ncbi:MAG: hypothetical protein WCG00_15670 [Hyphomicrobiales bacterium]|nr:hypothetical protein [Hyphomicrobiales bacterium]